MIRHCVFLNLQDDADTDALAATFETLGRITDRLEGASGFVFGPNRDFEARSQNYPQGFTIDFADKPALDRYIADPEHKSCGARLVSLCRGGARGIMVFDLECP